MYQFALEWEGGEGRGGGYLGWRKEEGGGDEGDKNGRPGWELWEARKEGRG